MLGQLEDKLSSLVNLKEKCDSLIEAFVLQQKEFIKLKNEGGITDYTTLPMNE